MTRRVKHKHEKLSLHSIRQQALQELVERKSKAELSPDKHYKGAQLAFHKINAMPTLSNLGVEICKLEKQASTFLLVPGCIHLVVFNGEF